MNKKALESNIGLAIELIEGRKGYYDTIWGTGNNNLKSFSIKQLKTSELESVLSAIIKFVVGVDDFKEDCYKKERF